MRPAVRPHGRILLVSRDETWIRRAAGCAADAETVPERVPWARAARLGQEIERTAALIAHVPDDDAAATASLFHEWARLALQAVTVVSIGPSPGALALESRLLELRYTRILHHRVGPADSYWAELSEVLSSLASRHLWLVPLTARILGRTDPRLTWVLTAAVEDVGVRSVQAWARRLGFRRRRTLQGIFRDAGLPPPARVLEYLRLARAVVVAAESGATRDVVAGECEYASGDYLGKVAKRLTDTPFTALVELGPQRVLGALVDAA